MQQFCIIDISWDIGCYRSLSVYISAPESTLVMVVNAARDIQPYAVLREGCYVIVVLM